MIVIGVHTPEFSFEHDTDLVREAIKARAIDDSVVVDKGCAIWSAFDNHYWPALYLVDREGAIRDHHFGEGRYEQSERVIQRLLDIERDLVYFRVKGRGVEAEADWDHLRTPRHTWATRAARTSRHRAPRRLTNDDATSSRRVCASATGASTATGRSGASAPDDRARARRCSTKPAGASFYRFHARDAHLVLASRARSPIPFRVRVDGEAPCRSRGVDVEEDGSGVLRDGRGHKLVRERDPVRERTPEITFLAASAEAYAFAFG